ncbi:MAG: 4'-phosphopantetheinyl transferase superfamily protein [Eubacteriales bacterium]
MKIYWSHIQGTGHDTAYALLERGWRDVMGCCPMPNMEKTGEGKPYFPGNPLYFSISHTKNLAVCAVGDSPLGVDVEQIRPVKAGMYQKVLTLPEQRWLSDHPDGFFHLWTKKEAYVKYMGCGLQGAPQRVDTTKLPTFLNIQSWELEHCVLTVCGEELVNAPIKIPSMG